MSVPYGPILVVEDIPHLLELIEITLQLKGYPVVTARDGEEALARVAEERPALILTDILMPKLDGFAFAHQVRSNPKTRDIPIIFISATYITPEDTDFALSLGAVTFLEKPVDAEELLLSVAEVLTREAAGGPDPLSDEDFYLGYRERLEAKLKHKQGQVERAQRLVETVPADQRPAFEAVLAKTLSQREEIEAGLETLHHILHDQGDTPSE